MRLAFTLSPEQLEEAALSWIHQMKYEDPKGYERVIDALLLDQTCGKWSVTEAVKYAKQFGKS